MMYDQLASDPPEPPGPPLPRTDFVVEAIKTLILSGDFRPGDALVEADLAKLLLVSKTPVREALKTLSGSGLVRMAPYRGATVRVVDANMARAVYELRALVEPEAVRRAVLNKWNFSAARAALNESRKIAPDRDRAKLSVTNRRFHGALTVGCGNNLMIKLLDELSDQTALITVAGWELHPSWPAEMVEHREILRAAEQGDADRAAELVRDHITTFGDRVVEGLAHGA